MLEKTISLLSHTWHRIVKFAQKMEPYWSSFIQKMGPAIQRVQPIAIASQQWVSLRWQSLTRPNEAAIPVADGLHLEVDPSGHIRAVSVILFATFCIFFIWSGTAPIDKGVPATGTVIAASNKKDIKYLTGGVVDNIFVTEGQLVAEGQPLVQINPTQASSSVNSTKQSMMAIEEQQKALVAVLQQKRIQLELVTEQVDSLRKLSQEGFIARTTLLDKEREAAQLRASIADDLGNVEKFKKQINESQEKLNTYRYEFENTTIKSPVEGYVNGLAIFTKGGSITPGTHLMDIIPKNDELVVEAQVPIHLIDKVKPNLEVDIILSAFNQNRTPHIPAIVTMVSPDKILDEKTNNPYYKIHVSVTKKGRQFLQDLQVRPGMPAEVLIKTGERTFLNYLIKPLIDRSYSSFKEE
jgi:membrane fusion protein, protease secretion system